MILRKSDLIRTIYNSYCHHFCCRGYTLLK